jgi:hypothetical protein
VQSERTAAADAQDVVRTPHKKPDWGEMRLKPLIKTGLRKGGSSVLSGSEARERVYLETI